jgi:hypothetical protein
LPMEIRPMTGGVSAKPLSMMFPLLIESVETGRFIHLNKDRPMDGCE